MELWSLMQRVCRFWFTDGLGSRTVLVPSIMLLLRYEGNDVVVYYS